MLSYTYISDTVTNHLSLLRYVSAYNFAYNFALPLPAASSESASS